jgi:hypothetical protein
MIAAVVGVLDQSGTTEYVGALAALPMRRQCVRTGVSDAPRYTGTSVPTTRPVTDASSTSVLDDDPLFTPSPPVAWSAVPHTLASRRSRTSAVGAASPSPEPAA